jgi:hypothetical protein
VVVLPAPLAAGRVRVQHALDLVEQLAGDERLVDALALDALPANDPGVHRIPKHPVHRALPRRVPEAVPKALLSQRLGE